MSHTPPDQVFEDDARAALGPLKSAREAMIQRLSYGQNYNDDHRRNLVKAVNLIASLETCLAELGVR